jgi:hypothetical protein
MSLSKLAYQLHSGDESGEVVAFLFDLAPWFSNQANQLLELYLSYFSQTKWYSPIVIVSSFRLHFSWQEIAEFWHVYIFEKTIGYSWTIL